MVANSKPDLASRLESNASTKLEIDMTNYMTGAIYRHDYKFTPYFPNNEYRWDSELEFDQVDLQVLKALWKVARSVLVDQWDELQEEINQPIWIGWEE